MRGPDVVCTACGQPHPEHTVAVAERARPKAPQAPAANIPPGDFGSSVEARLLGLEKKARALEDDNKALRQALEALGQRLAKVETPEQVRELTALIREYNRSVEALAKVRKSA